MNGKRRRAARERLRRMRQHARQRDETTDQPALTDARRDSVNGSGREGKAKKTAPVVSASAIAAAESTTTSAGGSLDRIDRQRQRKIDALERDAFELSQLTNPTDRTSSEVERIRREIEELRHEFYAHLGAWQRVQLARHVQRPHTDDYIRLLFDNFMEIHGDRGSGDDAALVAGMAWFHGKPIMIVGNQKGRDTKQRLIRNFGQAKPEGYRKALRAMRLAAKFNRPIFVFVDTPGAYPGVDAEERGQAEAIAHNLREMSRLPVPIVVTITGEGGSGGALAVAVGDRVLMLENSIYSVISPEGCASILWRDAGKAEIAAEALKITATDLLEVKLIDEIVPEPEGGAHLDHSAAARLLDPVLVRVLDELSRRTPKQLVDQRYEKFRQMGQFFA
ncbi:MAG TPA: acetyl-CoA carboxylase carboxyltransferase subunit alpha [Candidatus Acidoferrum sp.]|nr:acetyl-CoA carboxylase carboxyltransferase subunit alpha [Candidatus Acidoferrum sp.]